MAQWQGYWPGQPRLCPAPYFDMRYDPHKSGFVLVDLAAEVKHVTHKTRHLYNRLSAYPIFRTLCIDGLCLLTISMTIKIEVYRIADGECSLTLKDSPGLEVTIDGEARCFLSWLKNDSLLRARGR